MPGKSHSSTHPRKRRSPSKWVKNTNAIKYYKLKKSGPSQARYTSGGQGKYELVPRSKPKSLKIKPRKEYRVTASYLAWVIIWIVVPISIISIASLPASTSVEPFSVVVSPGDYATYKVTIQTGDEAEEDWEVNYYKYVVMAVEEHKDTNSILITFWVYNSTNMVFNGTSRTQKMNLTNTIKDIGMGGMSMGGGRDAMGGFGGTPPSGTPPIGMPPSGTEPPTGFSAGGFRGGTTISQILVPKEFDFSSFQNDLEDQYSEMSSRMSDPSSSSTTSMTVDIVTSTKAIETTMYSDESITMDQYSEYSLNGLLVKQSAYSNRESFISGETGETLTTTVLMANLTTVFY